MHYIINVSKNGQHFFATAKHSLTYESKARGVFFDFCQRFPKKDGFKIGMIQYHDAGDYFMDSDELPDDFDFSTVKS